MRKNKKMTFGMWIAAAILIVILILLLFACSVFLSWIWAKIFAWTAAKIMHIILPVSFNQLWFIMLFFEWLKPISGIKNREQKQEIIGRD
jgi:hypothetical protein